jgi:hypothetical protein
MKNKTSFFFLLCGFVMILSHGVMAACSSPSGSASQTRYDFGANKYYFCDNTDWVEIGGGGGGGGNANCGLNTLSWGGCSKTTGTSGTHGQVKSLTDSVCCTAGWCSSCSGATGSATATCDNGAWLLSGTTCNSCSVNNSGNRECSSCIAAGHEVLMADGTSKKVEDVLVGEELMGGDGKPTRVLEYDRPMMEHRDGDPQRLIQINDGGYAVTNNHPILTRDGWKALDVKSAETEAYDLLKGKVTKLEIGDNILMNGGYFVTVNKIEILEHKEDTRLYNFVLEGDPVFYVNGMAVMSFVADKGGKYTAHLEHEGEPK